MIPEKLTPLLTRFNHHKYFLLEGGRGGGKSQSVGRYLLYVCEHRQVRIVCGREIQKNIDESVYTLLADLIRSYELDFEIQSTRITHRKTGSVINFRGFREQGAFNIQGMEGVDVLWIDEAQALTKITLEHLIPTMREERVKIIFTMNRHVVDDPAFDQFAYRDDCCHIHINYDENPYCTQTLIKEAAECKKRSESDYEHIWLGKPLDKSEDAVFTFSELQECKINKHSLRDGYGMRLLGFDIARYGDDKCACIVLQQMGALHWEQIFADQWSHKDLNYTTGRIMMTFNEQNGTKAAIDEDGIGAGPLDTLNKGRGLTQFVGFRNPQIGYQSNKFFANNRTVNAYKTKDMVVKGHLKLNDDELIRELTTIRYTFDHNQRRILVSKDEMKKQGVKSPNLADALFMAVSLIGNEEAKQEMQFRSQRTEYPECNLFDCAGVR